MRTIGIADSPIIVDRSPPVAGKVNDGELYKVDLEYTMYPDKVSLFCCDFVMFHEIIMFLIVTVSYWLHFIEHTLYPHCSDVYMLCLSMHVISTIFF